MTDHIRLGEFFPCCNTWNVQERKNREPFNGMASHSIRFAALQNIRPHTLGVHFLLLEFSVSKSLAHARSYTLLLIISNRKLHYDCGYKCHTVFHSPQCSTTQMKWVTTFLLSAFLIPTLHHRIHFCLSCFKCTFIPMPMKPISDTSAYRVRLSKLELKSRPSFISNSFHSV